MCVHLKFKKLGMYILVYCIVIITTDHNHSIHWIECDPFIQVRSPVQNHVNRHLLVDFQKGAIFIHTSTKCHHGDTAESRI